MTKLLRIIIESTNFCGPINWNQTIGYAQNRSNSFSCLIRHLITLSFCYNLLLTEWTLTRSHQVVSVWTSVHVLGLLTFTNLVEDALRKSSHTSFTTRHQMGLLKETIAHRQSLLRFPRLLVVRRITRLHVHAPDASFELSGIRIPVLMVKTIHTSCINIRRPTLSRNSWPGNGLS